MRSLRCLSTTRLIFVGLYSLAMLLLPLAHHPVQYVAQDLTAFALPDGSLPILCVQPVDGSDQSPASQQARCEACLLISAPGVLAAPAEVAATPLAIAKAAIACADSSSTTTHFDFIANPRAPPIRFI
ncbi:hypothetical protein C6Y62_15950 [Hyphomicrobium sulfonivorans]|nr:hypothetical protein [Hyphomicrobium sulfonivorans]